MKEIPSLQERIRIYKEGDAEWEWFLTPAQLALLPPAAHAFWHPLDWVNYIGENWKRREKKEKIRKEVDTEFCNDYRCAGDCGLSRGLSHTPERSSEQPAQLAPIGKTLPIQDITKLSAKARAALALKGN